MKKQLLILAALLLLAAVLPFHAAAAEWEVFFDDGAAKNYIDVSSVIVFPEHKVRAWQKTEIKGGREVLSYVEMDCAGKMVAVLQVDSGKPVLNKGEAWKYVEPTEFGTARYDAWCTKRPPAAAQQPRK
ncbi:MAG TPA: hypothetical protein VGJ94_18830 [Syntrophorhabdaceae bacterium]|jgi:hypothetical protein